MIKGAWESVGLEPHIHTKGWGLGRRTMGGVWFVKMRGGTSGRCVVCMGDGVEIKFMVAHDKTNGQWE